MRPDRTLVDRDAVLEELDKIVDIKGFAYISLQEAIMGLPTYKQLPTFKSKLLNKIADYIDAYDIWWEQTSEKLQKWL